MFGWSGVFRRQQRRLKPSAYAYRRKPGRDELEREIQNTHNSRKDVRRNRFCVAPAGPTLGKALAISRLHLAWFLSRDRLPAHKPAGSPSCSDLPFTGVRGRVLAQILAQDLADVRLRQIVAELD